MNSNIVYNKIRSYQLAAMVILLPSFSNCFCYTERSKPLKRVTDINTYSIQSKCPRITTYLKKLQDALKKNDDVSSNAASSSSINDFKQQVNRLSPNFALWSNRIRFLHCFLLQKSPLKWLITKFQAILQFCKCQEYSVYSVNNL